MLKTLILAASILVVVYNQNCGKKEDWLKRAKQEGRVDGNFDPEKYQDPEKVGPDFLGKGGFGLVVKINYKPEGGELITVALKIINIVKDKNGKFSDQKKNKRIKSIEREVMWMKQFSHEPAPYFAKFYGCFYDETNYYIISEILDVDLEDEQFLESFNSAPVLRKLELMLDMARGVQAIHCPEINEQDNQAANKRPWAKKSVVKCRNITHNDIKPANFMLSITRPQHVKPIDMGFVMPSGQIAKAGTLRYMPPEKICKGNYTISPANDIWSLGVTFVQLMIHDRTWPDISPNYMKTDCKELKSSYEKHVSSFTSKYNSLYITDESYKDENFGALKILEKFILQKMLEIEAKDRDNINTVVEKLEFIISKLDKNSLYLSKNNTKLLKSRAFFFVSEKALALQNTPPDNKRVTSQFKKNPGALQAQEKPHWKLLI